jgi:hypothetical protein
MAVTRDLKPVLKAMRKDKKYKRLKEAFESAPIFQLPVERLADEIETLHKTRLIRILNTEEAGFVDNIVKANTQDQSVRGRLTEMMVQSNRVVRKLEKALKTMRFHMMVTFTDELRSFRTVEERRQIIEMVLRPFTDYINDMEMLAASATLVVTDIDKGNFSLSRTISVLEMHTARERRV